MSVPQVADNAGRLWQYHSRSDLHSKVACWGVLFDLLQQSALLKSHALAKKVIFGVNFEMRDYQTGRKKKLDLVVARPAGEITRAPKSMASLSADWRIQLDVAQTAKLQSLPELQEGV